ncbi:contact-dependent growth inhibition system immunity protein [Flavihumibacter solisilvae]|uniref:contact-dependent growth inhibition system immunity protein n=1 Tax=Flavihumibacter solisilvae TaxID=1349421 RepID=UPI00068FB3EA|nr:contact-dependent growth inhibition system immunity protein [Flavihumibacter solisilvae]
MKLENNWRQKSLEALEKQDWGDTATAPTTLVKRCIGLSKIPVGAFTAGDLRLMIAQQFGLPYLVPLAIEELEKDLLVETDYYEGDLLASILDVNLEFWKTNQSYWSEVNRLIRDRKQELGQKKISTAKFESLNLTDAET